MPADPLLPLDPQLLAEADQLLLQWGKNELEEKRTPKWLVYLQHCEWIWSSSAASVRRPFQEDGSAAGLLRVFYPCWSHGCGGATSPAVDPTLHSSAVAPTHPRRNVPPASAFLGPLPRDPVANPLLAPAWPCPLPPQCGAPCPS